MTEKEIRTWIDQILNHRQRVDERGEDPKESVIVMHPRTAREIGDSLSWYRGSVLPDTFLGFELRLDESINEGQVFIMARSIFRGPTRPPRTKPYWEKRWEKIVAEQEATPAPVSTEPKLRKIQMPEEA